MAKNKERIARTGRDWASSASRTMQRVANVLGVIPAGNGAHKKFRRPELEELDKYYENRQYDHLISWEEANASTEEYIRIRERKPRVIYAFAKVLCQRVASKLVGKDNFPTLLIEEDPDTQLFLGLVVKHANLPANLLEPVRRMLNAGGGLVRFYVVDGATKVESYLSKYCYPKFNASGELSSVRIQYVYCDPHDRDEKGKAKEKWYRLDLGPESDVLFDNPPYHENSEPEFTPVSTAKHGLGYVQGEWFRTGENKHSPDGPSLIEDIMSFIDEINYSLSQSSQAVGYNQDPQMTIKGMDTDQLDELVRSAQKAWNMGRDGEATFVESTLNGVDKAKDLRDVVKLGIQDVTRVLMLDPEKFAQHAQSGKAMEQLHGPLVELINEVRPWVEKSIVNLTMKIAVTLLLLREQGVEIGMTLPEGWAPKSFNVTAQWPPIFPMTITDLKEKVGVAVAASSANLIARETGTRWLAKDFNIEDIEAEIAKIGAQPVLNPFGSF